MVVPTLGERRGVPTIGMTKSGGPIHHEAYQSTVFPLFFGDGVGCR